LYRLVPCLPRPGNDPLLAVVRKQQWFEGQQERKIKQQLRGMSTSEHDIEKLKVQKKD